jgi:aspartate carbamoyltransferase
MSIGYEEFKAGLDDKVRRRELLYRDGRPFFVLISQQFDKAEIEALCDTATAIRRLERHLDGREFLRSVLRGYRIMNLFAQPSTRTAESFIAAADRLGAQSRLVSDLRTSSFRKGESVEDSVRTLSSFFDMIVARHHDDEFAVRASWALMRSRRSIPVISAGAGKSQHVTQSLLDIYTLRYSFHERGGLDGKTVLVVGDVGRNRAARSLAYLLTKFAVDTIRFVSPRNFGPDDALLTYLRRHRIRIELHENLSQVIRTHGREIDAMYVTRLQQEWDSGGLEGVDRLGTTDAFVLEPAYRELVRPECVVMHPLPRINELPDEWEEHPGFVVWRQVRNGMWMRASLFATVAGADSEIRARATRLGLMG